MIPKAPKPISLADSIAALREELEIAAQRQLNAGKIEIARLVPPLKLTEIVLETEVVAGYDREVNGKLNYWIASAGGSTADQQSATQKVTIRLIPHEGSAGPLVLGDQTDKDIT